MLLFCTKNHLEQVYTCQYYMFSKRNLSFCPVLPTQPNLKISNPFLYWIIRDGPFKNTINSYFNITAINLIITHKLYEIVSSQKKNWKKSIPTVLLCMNTWHFVAHY